MWFISSRILYLKNMIFLFMPYIVFPASWKMGARSLPPQFALWERAEPRRTSSAGGGRGGGGGAGRLGSVAAEQRCSEGFLSRLLTAKPAEKASGALLSEPQHGANRELPPSYHQSSGIRTGRGDLCLCCSLSETTLRT